MNHRAGESLIARNAIAIFCLSTLLSIVALGAGYSDEGKQREDAIRYVLAKLKDTNDQLDKFTTDLHKLQASADDIVTRTELLERRGEDLVVRFAGIKERDDQYGKALERHTARCPKETTDKALADSCNKEAAEGERRGTAIRNDLEVWTGDKDALVKAVEDLTGEAAENKRQLEHNIFSRSGLEGAKRRLQEELGRLGKEVKVCAEHLQGPVSCERLKHECGNVQFDGADSSLKDSEGTPCN